MNPTDDQIASVRKLMSALDSRQAVATAVADLLALGCWLHATGKKEVGLKAVDSALKAVNLDKTDKTLFLAIVGGIAGNEYRLGMAIEAHEEINSLLRQ